MKKFTALAVCCFVSISSFAREIPKLFHHRGSAIDQIVCYATQQPEVVVTQRQLERKGRRLVKKIFFLPEAHFSTEEAVLAKDTINKHRDATYSLVVKQSRDGLRLIFVYDPALTTVENRAAGSLGTAFIVSTPRKCRDTTREHPLVVLDYGHGGLDSGAIGLNKVPEKALTIAIGRKVKALLKAKGYEVLETRTHDTFIPLDLRTSLANQRKADLFVSLHINSAPRPEALGVETFYNKTVFSKLLNEKVRNSAVLAQKLQGAVLAACSRYKVVDRKRKCAEFQVLMGTEMPSALVELGFCSNPAECKRLSTLEYQQHLARGVAAGIVQFLSAR